MKKILFFTFLTSTLIAHSQATLFSENFQASPSKFALNTPMQTAYEPNIWEENSSYFGQNGSATYINTPDQPAGIQGFPNSRYMHIFFEPNCQGFGQTFCNAHYNAKAEGNSYTRMADPISTVGETGVSLNFWYVCEGETGVAYGTVEYSTNNGQTWTVVGPQLEAHSTWTQLSIPDPAFDDKVSLLFRFHWVNAYSENTVGNPALGIDDITITSTASTPVTNGIVTQQFAPDVCEGKNAVAFLATGTFNAGNVFTAQLSDASGSFTSPTTLGTLTSSASGLQQIPVDFPLAAGSQYRVRVTSSNPPIIPTSDNGTDFTLHGPPPIAITSDPIIPEICVSDSVMLTATGGVTYVWVQNSYITTKPYNAAVKVKPLSTDNYYVVGTDVYGCSDTADITIIVHNPQISIASTPTNATICSGQSATLQASGVATYSWSPPTGLNVTNQANVTATPTATTTYTISGTDNSGCPVPPATITVTIQTPQISVTSTPANATICNGQAATLQATGITTYSWTPATGLNVTNQATVIATPTATTTYTISGTDNIGCTATPATITVTVQNCAGIDENGEVFFSLYPNPTPGTLSLTVADNSTIEAINLLDNSGRLLTNFPATSTLISLEGYASGTYFVQLVSNGRSYTQRVTKN